MNCSCCLTQLDLHLFTFGEQMHYQTIAAIFTLHMTFHSYLFIQLAALGLLCGAQAFSGCRGPGLLFEVHRLLLAVASLAAHDLWALGLQWLQHRASEVVVHRLVCAMACGICFWTRDWTPVPCIGREILHHWTTREVPINGFGWWCFC